MTIRQFLINLLKFILEKNWVLEIEMKQRSIERYIGKYTKIALVCSAVFLGAENNTAMSRNLNVDAWNATPVVESVSSEDTVTSISVSAFNNGSATIVGDNIRVQGFGTPSLMSVSSPFNIKNRNVLNIGGEESKLDIAALGNNAILQNQSQTILLGKEISLTAVGNSQSSAAIYTNGALGYASTEIGSNLTEKVVLKADFSSYSTLQSAYSGATTTIRGKEIEIENEVGEAINVNGGTLTIGGAETERISISGSQTGLVLAPLSDNLADTQNGKVTLQAESIDIKSQDVAIWAQNSSTGSENRSSVLIDAGDITIEAPTAIYATSQGDVTLNGNTYIKSSSAVYTRGLSKTTIGKSDGTSIVQVEGDINFGYANTTSVDATVVLNLSGSNSYWKGNALVSWPGNQEKPQDEDLSIVNGLNLNLSNQARWDVVLGSTKDSNAESAAVSQLTLNDGIVNLLDKQVESIEIKELKGTGGTVNVVTTANENGTLTTPVLQVGTVESSAGSPTLLTLNYTGITSDNLTAENTKDLKALDIVSGTASVSEFVEEGDINGAWTRQDGEGEGSFQANTKLTDFSSVNAMSLVQWRNEINHLTKRLGDIRASEGTIGAWARVYGGESQWGGANEVEMDHTTIQVGGDYRINNHWIAGAAFSYTDSRADLGNGDTDGDSYSLAVYGTYTADGGSFLDVIGRYGYLKNDVTAGNMALDTSSNAFSLSAEMGHTFRFINDAAYVEPQIEFTYGFIGGDDSTASNNVRIEQDDFQSFVTRVGVRAGYDFPQKKGSFYGMFSYSYDWMGDADGTASKDGLRQALSQDLGGGWVTYGVGAQIMLGDSAYFYGELERTSGGDIDNPYQFSAGVRMTF